MKKNRKRVEIIFYSCFLVVLWLQRHLLLLRKMCLKKVLKLIFCLEKTFSENSLRKVMVLTSPCTINTAHKSLVIRQKGESQNRGNKKTKHFEFSEKTNISYPLIRTRRVRIKRLEKFGFFRKIRSALFVCLSGSKKCSFFRKIQSALFSFNLRFEPYYRRNLRLRRQFEMNDIYLHSLNQ